MGAKNTEKKDGEESAGGESNTYVPGERSGSRTGDFFQFGPVGERHLP